MDYPLLLFLNHVSVSMIASYLNLKSVGTLPLEADAILLVDRDGPLPLPVILERAKVVARRRTKIAVMASLVDVVELPPCPFPGFLWARLASRFRVNPLKDVLSSLVRERPDHPLASRLSPWLG